MLLLVAPEILFAFGLSNETELQVAATEAGIFLGLPAAAAVVLALVLSVMDVVRGTASVRRRIGLWWAIPVLGMALSWTTSLSDGRAGSGLLLLLVLAVPFGLAVDWILSAPPPQP